MSAGVAMWVETQVLLQVHWLLAEFSFLDFEDWGPMYLQTVSWEHSALRGYSFTKEVNNIPISLRTARGKKILYVYRVHLIMLGLPRITLTNSK